MRERPILFSAPMVRAIIAGTKTQTRRMVKWPVLSKSDGAKQRIFGEADVADLNALLADRQRHPLRKVCPYGQPGDRLWVRETWAQYPVELNPEPCNAWYRADGRLPPKVTKWTPSIHMPRWASRITLVVIGVRVERLQDISEEDAIAEGIERKDGVGGYPMTGFRDYARDDAWFVNVQAAEKSFASLWHSINGAESWDANPWVWVVEFKRVEAGRE